MADSPDAGAQGDGTAGSGTQPGSSPDAGAGAPGADRVTLLESRITGFEGRLTEQGRLRAAAEARAADLEAKVREYEAGKVNGDEALKNQLAEAQKLTAAAERRVLIAERKAAFPEAARELGDAVATLEDTALAALEARLTAAGGTSDSGDPADGITPRVPAAGRPRTNNTPKEETSADIMARLRTQGIPWGDQA
jgi:hypothetical protein